MLNLKGKTTHPINRIPNRDARPCEPGPLLFSLVLVPPRVFHRAVPADMSLLADGFELGECSVAEAPAEVVHCKLK